MFRFINVSFPYKQLLLNESTEISENNLTNYSIHFCYNKSTFYIDGFKKYNTK